MNLKVLIFLAFIVNFSLCQEELSENQIDDNPFEQGTSRIVGGQIIEIESVPYLASLTKNGDRWCDASIISNKWLLSAAHCFKDANPFIYKLRVGSSRASRGGKVFDLAKIINHPEYNKIPFNFDFTLLQIKGTITFNVKTKAIKLPVAFKTTYGQMEILTAGFGNTKNNFESSEFLRGVLVNVTDWYTCRNQYQGKYEITTEMFCAGSPDGGRDTCQGDSGGPVEQLSDGELIGVVSFGEGCALPDFPGVYAKVSSVRKWIKDNSGV